MEDRGREAEDEEGPGSPRRGWEDADQEAEGPEARDEDEAARVEREADDGVDRGGVDMAGGSEPVPAEGRWGGGAWMDWDRAAEAETEADGEDEATAVNTARLLPLPPEGATPGTIAAGAAGAASR